jgi:xanthine dehydrogenase accessory factor
VVGVIGHDRSEPGAGEERPTILAELAAAVARREPVASATVVRTSRSVPRHAGTRMLVYRDGRTRGTIGGGEMEHRVRTEAAEALATGIPRLTSYSLLDPHEGDPGVCGGEVDIYVEPHMPPATMYIIGAGHVGTAVSDLSHWLGYRTVVWDDRDDLVSDIATADASVSGPITEALTEQPVDADTALIVVTRNVALDLEILPALVATPARYIGLMGSPRRWDTTRSQLVDAGVSEADLERIHSPIGVEIGAETPEQIAVSIMAEVIGHQHAT